MGQCKVWVIISIIKCGMKLLIHSVWECTRNFIPHFIAVITRTTRMPAFWDTPVAPWLPMIHIRSKVKIRQIQGYKFLKIAKNSNFEILHSTLHTTHLKLVDKMYKYEMDPTITAGATERTLDAKRTDGVKPIYRPNNFAVQGGIRT